MQPENAQSRGVSAQSTADEISVELSSRRTGMSFQRTRLSADRTLMSVTRTSLALIGFGFTIYQVFQKLHDLNVLKSAGAARHFAELLVLLGNVMLVLGIVYHVRFMRTLRRERDQLRPKLARLRPKHRAHPLETTSAWLSSASPQLRNWGCSRR